MKKNILSLIILLFSFVSGAQVSQDKNYILYSTYDAPVQSGSESPSDKKQEAVYYLDGKGRVIQQTAIKAGSGNEDVSIYNDFDNFDRQKKQYLAFPKSNNNGAFITNAESLIGPYYNSVKYDNTLNPYAEAVFDQTHINRAYEVAHPGNEWQMAGGHTQKAFEVSNLAADKIRIYSVDYDGSNNPLLKYHSYYPDERLIKQVFRNENWVAADGNSNTTQIFSDFLGRRILMRNFDNGLALDTYYVYDDNDNLVYMIPPNTVHATLFNGATPSYTYPNMTQVIDLSSGDAQSFLGDYGNGFITISINNDILYVNFDATFPQTQIQTNQQTVDINSGTPLPNVVLGNLDCYPNLPGLIKVSIAGNMLYLEQNYSYTSATGFYGSFRAILTTGTPVTAQQSVLDKFCYQYKYDKKNRLIKKRLPGVEWQYLVYDDVNRPVLSQDYNQRLAGKWSFTKYDPLGRMSYSGTLSDTSPTQESMQAATNGTTTYTQRVSAPVNVNGVNVYYTATNTANLLVREINYYDDYLFDIDGLTIPVTTVYGDDVTTSARGLLTGTKSLSGNGNPLSTGLYLYDPKDRMVNTFYKNPSLATLDITESKIDFTGKVLESKSVHTKTGVIIDLTTYNYYTYDAAGRLTRHNQKIGNTPTELITFNKYDELGNLLEKKVGRSNATATISNLTLTNGVYSKSGLPSWSTGTLSGTRALVNDGNMSFTVGSSSSSQLILGLSYTPATTTYTQVNYGIMLTGSLSLSGGKSAEIQEGGITKFTTNYYAADEFTIERIGTVIYYKKNGVTVYQSVVAATTQNLYADGHFYAQNSNVNDININNYDYNDAIALQTIAYKFNVRGMLTKINDPAIGNALFNMEIKYASPTAGTGGTAFYNGNVSQIYWKTANDVNKSKRYYNFSYDHLHRLKSAAFYKSVGTTTTSGFYDESIKYDDAGNISSLQRNGTSESSVIKIDNLAYTYDGNKLLSVSDSTLNAEGFNNNGIDVATEFTYDLVGNLKTDLHKGITNIAYNELNLPTRITFSGTNRYIDFLYDAEGNKLSKTKQDGANTTLTEYAGDFVYVKLNSAASQLQYISQPEGYVAYNAGSFNYVYQYTDHLGNVRLSYTDANRNGSVVAGEIIEENNYYPFGLKHKGYNSVINPAFGNAYNKLGFEGQEMQEDLGLNWNSFKWRNYDPALGRFFNIDPLAEKYSFMTPYQFSSNQPVHAPELEGMESWDPICDDSDYDTYNVWGVSLLDDDGNQIITPSAELNEVVIGGTTTEKVGTDDNEIEEDSGFDTEDALEVGSYIPVIGGPIDMYRGIRDGNWLQFGIGAGSLALDIFTFGAGSTLIKGAAKGAATVIAKEAAEVAAKETAEIIVREVVEEGVEGVAIKTVGAMRRGSNPVSLADQAADLIPLNKGKNSITLRTSDQQIRYDLAGKAHGGVPTPHKQVYNNNIVNGVVKSVSRASKLAEPMTQEEIRMIRKYLEKF